MLVAEIRGRFLTYVLGMRIPGPVARLVLLRAAAVASAVVSLTAVAVAASRVPDARLVRARHEVLSPSGHLVARVEVEPQPDGTSSWRPVVQTVSGDEVYRSEGLFAAGPGLRIAWEPGLDTLWVLSADAGTLFVQQGPSSWTATGLTRDTADLLPDEVRAVTRS